MNEYLFVLVMGTLCGYFFNLYGIKVLKLLELQDKLQVAVGLD